MDVGIQLAFCTDGWDTISDAQVWNEDVRLARLTDRHRAEPIAR